MSSESVAEYDVTILGGGLAGLTLALQLKKQSSQDIQIAVIDRASRPLPEAACKVGESTVEVSSHYLADVLGFKEHIEDQQLPKLGLRCFFAAQNSPELPDRMELGSRQYWPRATYQLDRGRFENFLLPECLQAGIRIFEESRVDDVEISEDGQRHTVFVRSGEERHTIHTRWVVDATGRAALLRKKLGLEDECNHNINAVWFRIEDRVDINEWYAGDWAKENHGEHSRWFSTNHLIGTGYWTWIIPLASGSTSIGIVADPRYHPLEKMNSFEKSVEWLTQHEPRLGKEIAMRSDKVQDFLALKRFSRKCKKVFSSDRWALTGDAGVFIDPFYSPGADFIAYSNTFLSDLIVRDLSGQRVRQLTQHYNDLFISFAEHTFQVYENQYEIFGNPRVMPMKVIWDFAIYWCFFAFVFCNDRMCDINLFARFSKDLELVSKLNGEVQMFLQQWHQSDCEPPPAHSLDLTCVPFMYKLNEQLHGKLSDEEFDEQLRENIQVLARLASELGDVATRRCDKLELPSFVESSHLEQKPLLGAVYQQMAF